MNDPLNFETYLVISYEKFEIFLLDLHNLKNIYQDEFKLEANMENINSDVLGKFLEKNIFKIEKLSENIMNEQLNTILKNTKKLLNNFNMKKNSLIILSGIGQEILKDSFKNDNVQLLSGYFKSKNLSNKKLATYHAPAACIAGLLAEVIE